MFDLGIDLSDIDHLFWDSDEETIDDDDDDDVKSDYDIQGPFSRMWIYFSSLWLMMIFVFCLSLCMFWYVMI